MSLQYRSPRAYVRTLLYEVPFSYCGPPPAYRHVLPMIPLSFCCTPPVFVPSDDIAFLLPTYLPINIIPVSSCHVTLPGMKVCSSAGRVLSSVGGYACRHLPVSGASLQRLPQDKAALDTRYWYRTNSERAAVTRPFVQYQIRSGQIRSDKIRSDLLHTRKDETDEKYQIKSDAHFMM